VPLAASTLFGSSNDKPSIHPSLHHASTWRNSYRCCAPHVDSSSPADKDLRGQGRTDLHLPFSSNTTSHPLNPQIPERSQISVDLAPGTDLPSFGSGLHTAGDVMCAHAACLDGAMSPIGITQQQITFHCRQIRIQTNDGFSLPSKTDTRQ
jgi:hypothetical protein